MANHTLSSSEECAWQKNWPHRCSHMIGSAVPSNVGKQSLCGGTVEMVDEMEPLMCLSLALGPDEDSVPSRRLD